MIARSGISTRTRSLVQAVARQSTICSPVFQLMRAATGMGAQIVIGAAGGLTVLRAMARAPHSDGMIGPFDVLARPVISNRSAAPGPLDRAFSATTYRAHAPPSCLVTFDLRRGTGE